MAWHAHDARTFENSTHSVRTWPQVHQKDTSKGSHITFNALHVLTETWEGGLKRAHRPRYMYNKSEERKGEFDTMSYQLQKLLPTSNTRGNDAPLNSYSQWGLGTTKRTWKNRKGMMEKHWSGMMTREQSILDSAQIFDEVEARRKNQSAHHGSLFSHSMIICMRSKIIQLPTIMIWWFLHFRENLHCAANLTQVPGLDRGPRRAGHQVKYHKTCTPGHNNKGWFLLLSLPLIRPRCWLE